MAKITWNDKQNFIDDTTIPADEKITAGDMNQIKTVVNGAVDDIGKKQNSLVRGAFTGSIDDCKEIGCHYANFTNVTNAPYTSGYGWIDVKAPGGTYIQEIYRYSAEGIVEKAVRDFINNQWYPWRKIKLTSDGDPEVKRYTSSNAASGTTVTAIAQGRSVDIRVRGAAPNMLNTTSGYAEVGNIPEIGALLTSGSIIKRVIIDGNLIGQFIVEPNGTIKIGYTRDGVGTGVNINKNTTFYLEESFVMI